MRALAFTLYSWPAELLSPINPCAKERKKKNKHPRSSFHLTNYRSQMGGILVDPVGLWRVVWIWITILFADSCRHKCDLNAFDVISNKVYIFIGHWNRTMLHPLSLYCMICHICLAFALLRLTITVQTHRLRYIHPRTCTLYTLRYTCAAYRSYWSLFTF